MSIAPEELTLEERARLRIFGNTEKPVEEPVEELEELPVEEPPVDELLTLEERARLRVFGTTEDPRIRIKEEEEKEEEEEEEFSFSDRLNTGLKYLRLSPGIVGQVTDSYLNAKLLKESLYGGSQALIGSFQRTGQVGAEKLGFDKLAENLSKAADLNEDQAYLAAYEAKYGETGLKQLLNVSQESWWISTIGELIPGSAPFLAGAAGSYGVAFKLGVKNPYALLTAAMLGGGGAVFIQSYGDAYQEYITAHPNDPEGASDYAFKVSGVSAAINAASIPFGLVGLSSVPFTHYVKQALIQGSIGSVDTLSQNYMARENVDPTRDLTTSLGKSFFGEALAEGPILVGAHRRAAELRKAQKEEAVTPEEMEAQVKQEREDLNAEADRALKIQLKAIAQRWSDNQGLPYPKNLEDLEVNDLLKIIDSEGLNVGRVVEGEKRETVYQKIVNAVEDQEITKRIKIKMEQASLKKQREIAFNESMLVLDSLSPEELATYIETEFETAERYIEWANNLTTFRFDPEQSSRTFEEDKAALAFASANRITGEAGELSGRVRWNVGAQSFGEFVEQTQKQFLGNSLKEIRAFAKENLEYDFLARNPDKMTREDLIYKIAEMEAILQIQNEKLDRGNKTEKLQYDEAEYKDPVALKQINSDIELDGNALEAKVTILNDKGDASAVVNFARQGLDDTQSLADQMSKKGAQLTVTSVQGDNLANFEGRTINEVLQEGSGFGTTAYISEISVPPVSAPQVRGGSIVNGILGMFTSNFRPLTPGGLLVGSRYKQLRGRLRALDSRAQFLGLETERAILRAIDTGEVSNREEADSLLMAFLRKTGARIPLTEEQRIATEEKIARLNTEKNRDRDELSDAEVKEIDDKIAQATISLQGIQTTAVARQQLPQSLKQIATEIRTGIDSLSERILTELPNTEMTSEMRQLIEESLGLYVTRSFAQFEPGLGWSPQFTRKFGTFFKQSKVAQQLYDKALIAEERGLQSDMNNFRVKAKRALRLEKAIINEETIEAKAQELLKEKAEENIDGVLNKELFQTAYEIAYLRGALKPGNEAKLGYMKGGDLIQKRGHLSYTIRQLLGELDEAKLVAATSFARVSKIVETAAFYDELLSINKLPGEMWFSPKQIPGYNSFIDTGDPLNPLNGYWTTKEVSEMIALPTKPSGAQGEIFAAYVAIFGGAQALTQYGMIVLSPGTQARNLFGAYMMYSFNGHIPEKGDWSNATGIVMADLFGAFTVNPVTGRITEGNAEVQRQWEYLQELGVVSTEVRANDAIGVLTNIRDSGLTSVSRLMDRLAALRTLEPSGDANPVLKAGFNITKATAKTVAGVNTAARRAYAAADDFFKMMSFSAERRKLRASIDAFDVSDKLKLKILAEFAGTLTTKTSFDLGKTVDKALGVSRYEQNMGKVLRNVTNLDLYIDQLAAYMVRNTMPNYDYVGRFAEVVRLLPYGNFIAFPTEIARTSVNSAFIMGRLGSYRISDKLMKEGNIPKETIVFSRQEEGASFKGNPRPFKQRALERLIGGGISGIGIVKGAQAMGQLLFNIDDDELQAAELITPYESTPIPVGEKRDASEGGGFVAVNANYIAPYEALAKLMTIVAQEKLKGSYRNDTRTMDNALLEYALHFGQAYTDRSISQRVIDQLRLNRDQDTLKPIWDTDGAWTEKVGSMIRFIVAEAGPGGVKQAKDIIWALEEGDARYDDYGRTMTMQRALAKLMGMSNYEISPDQSYPFLISDVKKSFDTLVASKMVKEKYSYGVLTEEMVEEDWRRSQESWFKIQQELYFNLQQYEILGLSEDVYLEKTLSLASAKAGVPPIIIRRLKEGVFTPWLLPGSVEEGFLKRKKEKNLDRMWPRKYIMDTTKYLADNKISLTANSQLNWDLELNQLKTEE